MKKTVNIFPFSVKIEIRHKENISACYDENNPKESHAGAKRVKVSS